ncbi:hypothetical protein I547_3606 [Mycobacterium kansasii 824]|nr:hypothetical protein I547_3606 [Mycobacterium kansasii 824]
MHPPEFDRREAAIGVICWPTAHQPRSKSWRMSISAWWVPGSPV